MKYSETELALLWVDSFLGLSYVNKQLIYSLIKGKTEIKKILESNRLSLEENIPEKQVATIIASANKDYFDGILCSLSSRGIKAITAESDDYPISLLQTDEPPLVLYTKGNLELLKDRMFGIVGSRKNLPMSISIAEDYAKTLSKAGFTLVTGIAQGIDKVVIDSVKESGKIISVIAGGFDNIYPKSHTKLSKEIAEIGLIISEQPPEVVPQPFNFPVRNRIIAGLSEGVLIVSGAKKSGTLYTAEYAEAYGRDLFAVPYNVGIASGEGCNELIKRGASLTDTPLDILERYNLTVEEEREELTAEEKKVVGFLKDGALHINQLSDKLKLDIVETTTLLSMLVIKGIIVKSGTNIYGLARKILED